MKCSGNEKGTASIWNMLKGEIEIGLGLGLGLDLIGQTLVNNGEDVGKEHKQWNGPKCYHCFVKSAMPHSVGAVARAPNNPTPKYLDKGKQCLHKNYTVFMSTFFIKGQRENQPKYQSMLLNLPTHVATLMMEY